MILWGTAVLALASLADASPSHRYAMSPALRLRGGAAPPRSPEPAICGKKHVQSALTPLRGGMKELKVPKEAQLLIGALGIFLSFSTFAVLQEDVYKKAYGGEYFAFTFFAIFVERGINALTALIGDTALGSSGLKIPYNEIFQSGVSQMLAMAASNEALRYVSYPTQVLGKSCKMVPVMAGGIVFGKKQYSLIEYAQVALITAGVIIFNFGGKKKKGGKADSPLGLALISASLVMDMVTGGLQDKVKLCTKQLNPSVNGPKRPSMHESMLWTNLSGCLVALVLALAFGHLTGGIAFCAKHPEVLRAIVVYSLSSAVGQNFVYFTLTQFNPLVLTTVTTTRKIFSTLFSVFRNPANSLSGMQWSGCFLVFGGLVGDVLRKISAQTPPPLPPPPPPPKPAADGESA